MDYSRLSLTVIPSLFKKNKNRLVAHAGKILKLKEERRKKKIKQLVLKEQQMRKPSKRLCFVVSHHTS